ncbi:MAG: phosphoglucosamine mutase [Victivallaceae bacterium]|nr:phosphoglucosamine mutase [Victivallaceae bacterium]
MGVLFGTDGIRGRANFYPVTPEMALLVGKAVGRHFATASSRRVVLGKDTRLSGYMLENAVTAGLLGAGMDVLEVGPMPTPAVARLVRSFAGCCGIMITASHNPAEDNGIKIFDADGFKLSEKESDAVEALIFDEKSGTFGVEPAKIGKARRIDDARGRYIEFAKNSIRDRSRAGMKMVLDCANGAAYSIAPAIFRELGAEVVEIGVSPDGYNINCGCGAICTQKMCATVRECGADCGIALDGDADRVIFCDAEGNVVDGDRIIGMVALDYKKRGKLARDAVVVTSMSNLGLHRAMREAGIDVIVTGVGDHLVIEAMREYHCNVGGEQAGHVIFMDYVTTGDGIITALHVLKLMCETGKTLRELSSFMTAFPQETVNIPVAEKRPLAEMAHLQKALASLKEELGARGRAVVRYSGTENKLRILVEAENETDAKKYAALVADAVKRDMEL